MQFGVIEKLTSACYFQIALEAMVLPILILFRCRCFLQKVLASRKELIEYDTRVRDRVTSKITSNESTQARAPAKQLSTVSDAQSVPGRCYGCSSAATEHCVTLLKALAMKTSTRDKLIKEVREVLVSGFACLIHQLIYSGWLYQI